MENALKSYGEMLRGFRTDMHLSQNEAAKLLDVSQTAVSEWEAGKKFPRPENRRAMKILYSMPPEADFFNVLEHYTKEELKQMVVELLDNRIR